jgi:hypothetical protein
LREAGRGKYSSPESPERVTSRSTGAKGQGCSPMKTIFHAKINKGRKIQL